MLLSLLHLFLFWKRNEELVLCLDWKIIISFLSQVHLKIHIYITQIQSKLMKCCQLRGTKDFECFLDQCSMKCILYCFTHHLVNPVDSLIYIPPDCLLFLHLKSSSSAGTTMPSMEHYSSLLLDSVTPNIDHVQCVKHTSNRVIFVNTNMIMSPYS